MRTHRIELNGVHFRVVEDGSGPAVLLLHGFPDSSYLWRHQIPAFVGAGYRAIAPDLRGFGESDKPEEVEEPEKGDESNLASSRKRGGSAGGSEYVVACPEAGELLPCAPSL